MRTLARHFGTDTVFIVGSQAVLLSLPDAPLFYRTSDEIDMFPGNARQWEADHPGSEASEEIFALFGEMSPFSEAFGFHIDGVSDRTAVLPPDGMARASRRSAEDEARRVTAIAPSRADLAVSRLRASRGKDWKFVERIVRDGHATAPAILALFLKTDPGIELRTAVEAFLASLPARSG